MITMMEHPKHGRHPATGHEVEHMKANGWTVSPPKVAALPEQVEEAPTAPAPRRRGPNKPRAK